MIQAPTMRNVVIVIAAAVAALAGGCKKKSNEGSSGSAGAVTGGTGAATAGGAAATGDGTLSATSGSMGELKPIAECPPALRDTDKGLRRTIPAGCSTRIEGDYYVDGELVVEAGATLAFAPGAAMYVGYGAPAKLTVRGTKEQPVTFTSGGDKVAGAWKGITIYARSPRSELAGAVVEHASTALTSEAPDLTVKDSTFRDHQVTAVRVDDQGTLAAFTGNTFDRPGEVAMSVPPAALVGLGANTFPADAVIEVRGGSARKSGAWRNPGAPFRVAGEIYIDAESGKAAIEIAAGNRFRMGSDSALYVGYTGDAELKVAGTIDAPVIFESAGTAEPGAWERGIIVYRRGVASFDHAVVKHGGASDKAAIRLQEGKLAITNSTIEDNVTGVHVDDVGELKAFDHNRLAGNREKALELHPRSLGALGAGNTYGPGQTIVVHGGTMDKASTWLVQPGAAVVVDSEIYVDGGEATIPAGATYAFTEAGAIYVGYGKAGRLVVTGTADKPVTFQGARDAADAWKGIELYDHSSGSSLAHVVVKGATLRASETAKVTRTAVTCSPTKC